MMSDLTIERPESGYAVWKNRDGDIVCDWNDDANINFPEDLTSHRDIGDLVSVVYKKGFSDGNMQLKQQLSDAVEVIEFYGNKANWETRDKSFDYLTLAKIINEDDLDDRDSFFVKTHGGKLAREFLAKYRGGRSERYKMDASKLFIRGNCSRCDF